MQAQQIIDLRPTIDTNTVKYVELSGLDSIDTWYDLKNSICSQSSENEIVFLRLSLTADTIVTSTTTNDHIIIALKAHCDDRVSLKKAFELGMASKPYFQGKIIQENELKYHLFKYYDIAKGNSFLSYSGSEIISYADYRYRIDVAALRGIDKSIRLLKIIANAYIDLNDDFNSDVPPLILLARTHTAPPPPPPPPSPID